MIVDIIWIQSHVVGIPLRRIYHCQVFQCRTIFCISDSRPSRGRLTQVFRISTSISGQSPLPLPIGYYTPPTISISIPALSHGDFLYVFLDNQFLLELLTVLLHLLKDFYSSFSLHLLVFWQVPSL